jgi:hypothetical protein
MSQVLSEGEIFIEMPSTVCVGGQFISGKVNLNILKVFNTDQLTLRFKGYERSFAGCVSVMT